MKNDNLLPRGKRSGNTRNDGNGGPPEWDAKEAEKTDCRSKERNRRFGIYFRFLLTIENKQSERLWCEYFFLAGSLVGSVSFFFIYFTRNHPRPYKICRVSKRRTLGDKPTANIACDINEGKRNQKPKEEPEVVATRATTTPRDKRNKSK